MNTTRRSFLQVAASVAFAPSLVYARGRRRPKPVPLAWPATIVRDGATARIGGLRIKVRQWMLNYAQRFGFQIRLDEVFDGGTTKRLIDVSVRLSDTTLIVQNLSDGTAVVEASFGPTRVLEFGSSVRACVRTRTSLRFRGGLFLRRFDRSPQCATLSL